MVKDVGGFFDAETNLIVVLVPLARDSPKEVLLKKLWHAVAETNQRHVRTLVKHGKHLGEANQPTTFPRSPKTLLGTTEILFRVT